MSLNTSLKQLFFSRITFQPEKKIKFLKNFEPVIFEDFFIKNWESFKKWKTKGFYTIFTTNEHEWISAIDFKWLIVTHHELSHSKTTRWLVNYERKSFRPNFIIQTIELIWSIWEKPIRPIRYQSTIVPPTTAKVSTWPFFLSRNTVFFSFSDHNRFRMANGLLYRLFEETKDWITGFIHLNRETSQVQLRSDRLRSDQEKLGDRMTNLCITWRTGILH